MTARERKKEKKKKTLQTRLELEETEGSAQPPWPPAPAAMAKAAAEAEAPMVDAVSEPASAAVSTGKNCNTCGGSFESDAAYRLHFRLVSCARVQIVL